MTAPWPIADDRDPATETAVDAAIELVRGVRNARAEAGVEAAAWLPVGVLVPTALREAFSALAPAIERLARARPLLQHATRVSLEAGPSTTLAVIAGGLEARIELTVDADTAQRDRGRLEKELAEAEGFLEAAQARLANEAFLAKAPPTVVAGARARAAELLETVDRLRARLGG
jgi:valyl-tRNA synthetase